MEGSRIGSFIKYFLPFQRVSRNTKRSIRLDDFDTYSKAVVIVIVPACVTVKCASQHPFGV